MDALLLSRIHFAVSIGVHFIFPPITIGLAWLLVFIEYLGWKRDDSVYVEAGKFFGKVLALTFAVGVATGIVMEFQFGTNWAEYSKFVGDIFGAPLAAEGVFAFFLESGFMGLYLFGRNRVSRGLHWFSILMVAVGATISAFWILVANSWQQTPAGYVLQNGRAELTNFAEAVFNPSTFVRFFHTVDAALISGAFVIAGISAYLLIRSKDNQVALRSIRIALITGLVFSLLELFPFGHEHAKQVAETQPEKFATIEGLTETQEGAPMVVFGIPVNNPPGLKASIEIPKLLSWIAFGDFKAEVKGLNEFPQDERPPFILTFISFHTMVALGMYFILVTLLGVYFILKKKLVDMDWFKKILLYSAPLPVIACELGWITAEVGRQPWIVYRLLRTADAYSFTVPAGNVLFTLILFSIVFVLLVSLYLFLLFREVRHFHESGIGKEVKA